MELLKIYESLLKFAGLTVDEEGYISTVINDRREPIHVGGARLVLPTHEQLRRFNPNEKVIFHPLAEDILKSESEVVKKFRDVINTRLNYTIGIVAQSLLNVIASTELHKRLNPEQMELLLAVKDVDDKTVSNFIQHMVSLMKTKPDRAFVNIFLKKGGYKGKDKFARLAVVSFPFYESLTELKVRKKDQEAFKQLFDYLFINIDVKDEYNYGSDSRIAPYLDALMHSAANVASGLNDTLQLFDDYIDEADKLVFNSDWYEYFQTLEELLPEIRKIPIHSAQQPAESEQQTISYNQPAPPAQYPVQPGYPVQPPLPGYPSQPAYPPQQPPQPVRTERGLDFRSMVNSNPMLAAAQNPLMPHLMQQQMLRQAQQPPGWYQPAPIPPQGYPQQPPAGYAYPPQPYPGYPQPGYPQAGYPQQPGYPVQQPPAGYTYPPQGYTQ